MISQSLNNKIDVLWDLLNQANLQAAHELMSMPTSKDTIKAKNAIDRCLTELSEVGNIK